jgi:tol-pal system protein YbgF
MNCPEAREAFSDLYDGTLSGPPLAALSQHLDSCPACRAEWVAFRRAMHALKDLGHEEPSRDFAARVAERIEAPRWWQRAAATLVFPLRVKLPIHAAALVLLGMAGLWMSQRSPELQQAAVGHAPVAEERPAPAPEAAPPVTPPTSAKRTEAIARRSASPPKTVGPQKSTPPPAGAGKIEGPAAAPEDTDVTHALPAREEAVRTMVAPPAVAAPQAQGDVADPGRLQSAPPLPEARAKAELTPRAESGVSAVQRRISAPAGRSADDLFSSAATEFAAQHYEAAIGDLRAFLAQHPNDARVPDARFLLADAYRAQRRYAEASAEFEAFLRQYPAHRRAPVALYRQGEIRLLLGDQSGCNILRDALNRYPDASEAATARETLAARCP